MSDEIELPDLFAPQGGWRVRILDLSGANAHDENVVEEVAGFPTVMHANAFARAYVRDSVELCRQPGMTAREVLADWRVLDPRRPENRPENHDEDDGDPE